MPKTQRLSDAALVRRSQQGDRRAFGALVARYDRRLRGLAHALLLDPAQMDTALGLAYLRAWRDVVRIKPRDDVGPWLYRAAYNACIDQLRRNDAPGPAPQPATSSPPGGFRAALAGLAPADRVAVVLVEREGFSVVSAARILGMSPEQLESRLVLARERLAPFVPAPPPEAPAPAAELEVDEAEAAVDESDDAEPVVSDAVEDDSEAVESGEAGAAVAADGESEASEAESVAAEQSAAAADDAGPVVDEPADLVEPEPAVADAADSETDEPGAEAAAPTSGPGDPAAAAVASSDGHGGNGHGPPAPGTNGSTNGKSNGHGNRGRGRRARRRANGAAAATAPDATIVDADTGGADTADRGDDADGTADGSAEPAGASSTTGEHRIADG